MVYRRTPVLDHAPYIESIVESFEAPKHRVRLMHLQPGKDIFWHVLHFAAGLGRGVGITQTLVDHGQQLARVSGLCFQESPIPKLS